MNKNVKISDNLQRLKNETMEWGKEKFNPKDLYDVKAKITTLFS